MPTNENKPRCPYCQVEFLGSHSCQASPKDDYFRGLAQERTMTGAEIRREREWYDRIEEHSSDMPICGVPIMEHPRRPWDEDKKEKEKEYLT